jgi:hypothetical protein
MHIVSEGFQAQGNMESGNEVSGDIVQDWKQKSR